MYCANGEIVQAVDVHQLKFWGMDLEMDEDGFMEFEITGSDLGFCAHWAEPQSQPSVKEMRDWLKWQLACPAP
jgi:hypothetical protein